MNILTIIILATFLTFIIIGAIRGLFRSVSKVILTVLAFFLSYFLAPFVGSLIIANTQIDEYIAGRIHAQIEETVEKKAKEQVKEMLGQEDQNMINQLKDSILQTELTKNEQVQFIYEMNLPQAITNAIMENNNDSMKQKLGVHSFYDYISNYVARTIVNSMAFALTSIVFWILFTIINWALALAVSLPIISSVDRVGGALCGACEALLIIWLFFVVVAIFIDTEFGKIIYTEVSDSPFLTILYDKNIFMPIVTKLHLN